MPECPACHSPDVHRLRRRFWILPWIRARRRFRCAACGHYTGRLAHSRGKQVDSTLTSRRPNLDELDREFDSSSAKAGSKPVLNT